MENETYRASARRPDRQVELGALRERLRQAIESLPEHEREIFVLREYDGRRYKEIAELAEIPIGTVMSRLYSARRRLMQQLDDAL